MTSRRVPVRIGAVDIDDALGEGGMGVVYVGTQPTLGRRVVVKGLRSDTRAESNAIERFQREAQSMASIQHQNVVAVFDAFEWRSQPWIVEEYVDGADLARLLAWCRPLEPRLAALIALSVLRGLEEIHDRGIVHRDLKPSNVLVGRGGDVKICDFGIAIDHHGPGLTRTGFALGTVPYSAPEQLLGETVDFRGDIFALGVILYEMLCGDVPFPPRDPDGDVSLVRRIQRQDYVRCRKRQHDVPRWLARATETCLRAKPRRRAGSTTDLRREFERRLDQPSPTDTRAEIAAYLTALDPDDAEIEAVAIPTPPTKIAPVGPHGRDRDARSWMVFAAATVLTTVAALVVLGAWLLRQDPLGLARATAGVLG